MKKCIKYCLAPLTLSLVLMSAFSVTTFAASTNDVVTGRTEQNVQTGVITMNSSVQTEVIHNVTTSVELSGKVVIDGPQLVLEITDPNGLPVLPVSVTKVADKTFTFKAVVNPSDFKGNVNYTVNAKTIYANGKVQGKTHTTAVPALCPIHVAYVTGFEVSSPVWGVYDRDNNQYGYDYDVSTLWDNGKKDMAHYAGIVSGEEVVTATLSNVAYDGDAVMKTFVPPVNIRSFELASPPQWEYISSDNKYSLSFDLKKVLSNGKIENAFVQVDGVEPSSDYVYTASDERSPDYSTALSFHAPESPKPSVSNVRIVYGESLWTGNNGNGGNVQLKYTLNYQINGVEYSKDLTHVFQKDRLGQDVALDFNVDFDDQTLVVVYTLEYKQPTGTTPTK